MFDVVKRLLSLATHRLYTLPVLVLMPHGGCNCRCVMCDIWKENGHGKELSGEALRRQIGSLRRLNVRLVVLSGGEALLHDGIWELCEPLKQLGARITLLSNGLLLSKHADGVVRWCDEVTVSLDGSRAVHDAVRGVSGAFDQLTAGVKTLKTMQPGFRVTARCVIQRHNYLDLPGIVETARQMGLDQISFLAADVADNAFDRGLDWIQQRVAEVALSLEETLEFNRAVEQSIGRFDADFKSGFIAESPAKLRRLARYYAALNGQCDFPPTVCNAPRVSTVVEADGTVRPCFFSSPHWQYSRP